MHDHGESQNITCDRVSHLNVSKNTAEEILLCWASKLSFHDNLKMFPTCQGQVATDATVCCGRDMKDNSEQKEKSPISTRCHTLIWCFDQWGQTFVGMRIWISQDRRKVWKYESKHLTEWGCEYITWEYITLHISHLNISHVNISHHIYHMWIYQMAAAEKDKWATTTGLPWLGKTSATSPQPPFVIVLFHYSTIK